MIQTLTLNDLRSHLGYAKDKLSLEKQRILTDYPLDQTFNREEYVFAYVRAERISMRAINRRLAEIAWLPMQLDPRPEMLTDDKQSMKRWLTSALIGAPSSDSFGNDFIHTLTRCGLQHGWDGAETIKLTARIANLFRDLSCLVGLIYYCTWMEENNIDRLQLSNPQDVGRTAEEVATLLQSPDIYRFLRAQSQDIDKKMTPKKVSRTRKPEITQAPQKQRPFLHLVHNPSFQPDPAMV